MPYITPTLLNNFYFYMKSGDGFEESAKESFMNCLNKIKTERTEAMQLGVDYEDTILNVCTGGTGNNDPIVNEIAWIVGDGIWQEPVMKTITINDLEVLLYGKCDVIKQDTIYDIKRSKKYEIGKFLYSSQHLIYMYCSGIPNFKYLVSTGKDLFIEEYNARPNLEAELQGLIYSFLNWLYSAGLIDLYLEKWRSKNGQG